MKRKNPAPLVFGGIRIPIEVENQDGLLTYSVPCWKGTIVTGRDPRACRDLLREMVREEIDSERSSA